METKMWRKWFNMVLRFSKALSPHSLELITQANVIIKKLNGIVSDIQSTQNLEAENHNIQDEILPLIKDQQYHFSKRITELEAKKKTILDELSSLGSIHIVERKKLNHELQNVEDEISLNCNNFLRVRDNHNDTIDKLVKNKEFIDAHPLEALLEKYSIACTSELNPIIKKLSTALNIKLQPIDPTTPQNLSEFTLENEKEDYAEFE